LAALRCERGTDGLAAGGLAGSPCPAREVGANSLAASCVAGAPCSAREGGAEWRCRREQAGAGASDAGGARWRGEGARGKRLAEGENADWNSEKMRKESLLDEVFTAISSNLSSQINLVRLLELLLGEDANFVIS